MTGPDKDNDRIVTLRSVEEIEDEAAAWLIALSREGASAEDVLEFKAWQSRSARHREVFERLAALWDDLGGLKVLDDYAESVAASVRPRPLGVRRTALMAMAVSMSVALAIGAVQYANWSSGLVQDEAFETAVGEQITVHLSDGSDVLLNTNSRLNVAYARNERKVTLLRGEAHFTVAKSQRRPYLVYAGDGFVRAVGTAFTVRLRQDDAVEVTVEEGRVALSTGIGFARDTDGGANKSAARELAAGTTAVYGDRLEHVAQLPPAELSRKLAWRQGVLAYAGEPLHEVVADISRYTDITIEIADPRLKSRPIGGYFKVGDVEEMFESLELNFGLTVERSGEGYVRITASP